MKHNCNPRLPFRSLLCLFAVSMLSLNFSFSQQVLQKQINTLPWYEDFNSADPPDLPLVSGLRTGNYGKESRTRTPKPGIGPTQMGTP
jgi:hypothetical protein